MLPHIYIPSGVNTDEETDVYPFGCGIPYSLSYQRKRFDQKEKKLTRNAKPVEFAVAIASSHVIVDRDQGYHKACATGWSALVRLWVLYIV